MSEEQEKCQWEDCDEPVFDKGYCLKHGSWMEEYAYASYMDRLHDPSEEELEDE